MVLEPVTAQNATNTATGLDPAAWRRMGSSGEIECLVTVFPTSVWMV